MEHEQGRYLYSSMAHLAGYQAVWGAITFTLR